LINVLMFGGFIGDWLVEAKSYTANTLGQPLTCPSFSTQEYLSYPRDKNRFNVSSIMSSPIFLRAVRAYARRYR
jgi:hypothetical protein